MWARVVEITIGCWLLMSPFIFGHETEQSRQWTVDLAGGAAVIALAALSWWSPTRYAHLVTVLVALSLIAFGRLLSEPIPAAQNDVIVGLLLLMFAIVPSEASEPPQGYRTARSAEV